MKKQFVFITRATLAATILIFFSLSSFSQDVVPITLKKKGFKSQYYQGEQLLTKTELGTLLNSNPESAKALKTATMTGLAGSLMLGTGALVIGISSLSSSLQDLNAVESGSGDSSDGGMTGFFVGVGLAVTAIPLVLVSNSQMVKSIRIYNSQGPTGSVPDLNLQIGVISDGLSIRLRF